MGHKRKSDLITKPKETNKVYYYLYQITNLINDYIYIGVHHTYDLDDGYMGSGYILKEAIEEFGIENFKKEILKFFKTEEEMYKAENKIVNKDFIARNDTYNINVGGSYRKTTDEIRHKLSVAFKGKTLVLNLKTNKKEWVDLDDKRFDKGILVGHTNGWNTYIDTKTNKKVRAKTDDKNVLNGRYVGLTTGRTCFKDKKGNPVYTTIDDPRVKSGELVGFTKGCKQTKESNIKRSNTQKGRPLPYLNKKI